MSELINIKGIDKSKLLAALFNASRQQGMGFIDTYGASSMTEDDAKILIENSRDQYFDYVRGRVMKIDLSGDELDPYLYDRDNGSNEALNAIKHLLV